MKQALAFAVPVVNDEDADVSQQDEWGVPHDVGDDVCVDGGCERCRCFWRSKCSMIMTLD